MSPSTQFPYGVNVWGSAPLVEGLLTSDNVVESTKPLLWPYESQEFGSSDPSSASQTAFTYDRHPYRHPYRHHRQLPYDTGNPRYESRSQTPGLSSSRNGTYSEFEDNLPDSHNTRFPVTINKSIHGAHADAIQSRGSGVESVNNSNSSENMAMGPTLTSSSPPSRSDGGSSEGVGSEPENSNVSAQRVGGLKVDRVCNVCWKSFDRPSTLTKHMVVHTQVRPYLCPLCDARFGVKSNMSRHVRQFHPDAMPPPNDNPPRTRTRSLQPARPITRVTQTRASSMPPIPPTLAGFRIGPSSQFLAVSSPANPVVPDDKHEGYESDEERNSFLGVDAMMPYHPERFTGRLPGPNGSYRDAVRE